MVSVHKLRYRQDSGAWQEFLIEKDDVFIGRETGNDLVLDQDEVSRRHARLQRSGEHFQLIDLGSSNGTRIEGRALVANMPHTLEPGQHVSIGDFTLMLAVPAAEETFVASDQIPEEDESLRLRYRLGGDEWETHILSQGETVIGREEKNDLVLDDKEISRQHALLRVDGTELWLKDLGSTNGTRVDGVQLNAHLAYPLQMGQFIKVGNHTLYVEAPSTAGGERIAGGTMIMSAEAAIPPGAGPQKTMLDLEMPVSPTPTRMMDLTSHERVTIGRAVDNQVVLNYPLVSRYHAMIERLGKRYRIKDLRSTNGVYVNEKRVEGEAFLKDYDQIRIGPFVFQISGERLQGRVETGLRIEARNINQQVSNSLNLLNNINMNLEPNEFVALVGMSGSGKTTFLNALSGYWPASHGRVLVNGIDLYDHYDLFRNDIGYVPQKDIVHAELTPEEALDYVAKLRMPPDTTAQERRAVVGNVLEELDLAERRNVPISSLSGGQLKRVSIGVELLTKPRLFFLDEPTSGLDPGTEYDMMKLMRRLADQGRTVILITHATKNVMFCDKVIFLARGGNLAFYGPPEDALAYFDQHRTERERREKKMEFDDIYRILDDPSRGAPEEWRQRYLESQDYLEAMGWGDAAMAERASGPQPASQGGRLQVTKRRISSLRQFLILSSRNLKIMFQDKVSLALMLALAPLIGLMDFIWGNDLYDPVVGDATKIITLWFMMALTTVLVGALSSVREIVKEVDIYKRERAVNLRIVPYVFSKVWVGVVLALYQGGVLLLFRLLFVRPEVPSPSAYLGLYITLFLSTLCGYVIGLVISSAAPNQNSAMMLIIVVLVPQFLFAGALLPLDLIPGGKQISALMPTRWGFEAMVRLTGMGQEIAADPCWTSFPKADRLHLPEELKEHCPCMGVSIFTECNQFPGILSDDIFDEKAKTAIVQPKPVEPPQPTPYPYPTPVPSPTALPTPTSYPSPTPNPTPSDPRNMGDYMDLQQEQGQSYQDRILEQFEAYRLDSQEQGAAYSQVRTAQGDEYAERRKAQGDEYADAMQIYGDSRAEWQESRDKAISSAEAVLGAIYDNFPQTFRGSIVGRWMIMIALASGFLGIVFVFQKRKDVV